MGIQKSEMSSFQMVDNVRISNSVWILNGVQILMVGHYQLKTGYFSLVLDKMAAILSITILKTGHFIPVFK